MGRVDINELATRAHCSRATVYRHSGGKKNLVEAVFLRAATLITDAVHHAVAGRAAPADTARASPAVRSFLALLLWPPLDTNDEPHLVEALTTALSAHDPR